MMKITYYAATSSDGFIARENGDVAWLDEMNIDMADTGYDTFFESVDGLVMGRGTFLKAGLLTHLWVSEMPIALGKGIPLFAHHKLDELRTKNSSVLQKNGFKEIKKTLNNDLKESSEEASY